MSYTTDPIAHAPPATSPKVMTVERELRIADAVCVHVPIGWAEDQIDTFTARLGAYLREPGRAALDDDALVRAGRRMVRDHVDLFARQRGRQDFYRLGLDRKWAELLFTRIGIPTDITVNVWRGGDVRRIYVGAPGSKKPNLVYHITPSNGHSKGDVEGKVCLDIEADLMRLLRVTALTVQEGSFLIAGS